MVVYFFYCYRKRNLLVYERVANKLEVIFGESAEGTKFDLIQDVIYT